jgi:hypothetical protein
VQVEHAMRVLVESYGTARAWQHSRREGISRTGNAEVDEAFRVLRRGGYLRAPSAFIDPRGCRECHGFTDVLSVEGKLCAGCLSKRVLTGGSHER